MSLVTLKNSSTISADSVVSSAQLSRTDTWSPVGSINFTSASKLSRGGAGHLGDLFRHPLWSVPVNSIMFKRTGVLKAEAFSRITLRKSFTISSDSVVSSAQLTRTDTWTPVGSINFTSAAKLSRGGAGHLGDLFRHPLWSVPVNSIGVYNIALLPQGGTVWTASFECDGKGSSVWANITLHFGAFTASGIATVSWDGRKTLYGVMSAAGVATAVFSVSKIISATLSANGIATARFTGTLVIKGYFECDGAAGNIVFITYSNGVPIEGLIASLPPATFPAGASVGILLDSPHSY